MRNGAMRPSTVNRAAYGGHMATSKTLRCMSALTAALVIGAPALAGEAKPDVVALAPAVHRPAAEVRGVMSSPEGVARDSTAKWPEPAEGWLLLAGVLVGASIARRKSSLLAD